MIYDFDTASNRSNTNSLKYDFAKARNMPEGLLPLWVADMDFSAPPKVLEDLRQVASHGIFGYTEVKDAYYAALNAWFSERFGFSFAQRDVVKSPGVVFALAQAVRAFTQPGDAVLIQTPVYYPFYEVIRDNGRAIASNPLRYENGAYSIDFADFERKIRSESVKLFLLCSPHNPVGRVWTRAELEALNEICERHGVLVVSDEIHCDFVHAGHRHTCFGLINQNAVIATAPSKTFNLAGLQVANIIVPNEAFRRRFQAEIGKTGYS
ncbi:MAG TPA: aminotransferase class I/II-fold pyridoxal phosphate-dependent enzyme, partial [Clostridia bacterium]|nr:aminotransferase class I/II-fold pyridoxal phosphate-dependent enzyme [Clostridia bacterium]